MRDESLSNVTDAIGAHHDYLCAGGFSDGWPINAGVFFGRVAMASDDGDAGTKVAMSERNSGVIRDGHERRDTRDNFEGNAGIGQLHCFFAAAAENVGIATFEANHRFAGASALDEQLVELLLRDGMIFGSFA